MDNFAIGLTVTAAIIVPLGIWMVAQMLRHEYIGIEDWADETPAPPTYAVTVDGSFRTDDIDAYLADEVARHGGRVEATTFGYRHIWSDGTRKVYWEAQ